MQCWVLVPQPVFLYSQDLHTRISEVKLFAFAYRLFHEDICCYKPGQSIRRIITDFPLFNVGWLRLQVNFSEMLDGMWSFTIASTGSCQGTLTGSLMETWIGRSSWRPTRALIGKDEPGLDIQLEDQRDLWLERRNIEKGDEAQECQGKISKTGWRERNGQSEGI